MDKSRRIILKIGSYVLVAALAAGISFEVANWQGQSKLETLADVIENRFVEETDRLALEDAAAGAMVQALNDPWSYYIPASEYESLAKHKTNSYVGVGITIQLRQDKTGIDITLVEPEGPAQKAGILPGDVLVAVSGQRVGEMTTEQVRNLVVGDKGTDVELTLLRDGEEFTVCVTRGEIGMVVAQGQLLENHIGLVTIRNFNDKCAQQTIGATEELIAQGAQALVFDVRNNGGGYMHQLTEILDYLLPQGDLVFIEEKGERVTETSDENCVELPMAVLINENTVSAAELFAAVLEEYHWAVTVGQETGGKGYFQYTIKLPDGSGVNLSAGKYMTGKGVNLQQAGGLKPQIEVLVSQETAAQIYGQILPPEQDPQLQAALAELIAG